MTEPLLPMPGLNPFDPAATDMAIFKTLDEATAAIPPGHTHAILLDATDVSGNFGGTVSFIQKAPDGWNIVAEGEYDQAHGFGGSVLLGKSW